MEIHILLFSKSTGCWIILKKTNYPIRVWNCVDGPPYEKKNHFLLFANQTNSNWSQHYPYFWIFLIGSVLWAPRLLSTFIFVCNYDCTTTIKPFRMLLLAELRIGS